MRYDLVCLRWLWAFEFLSLDVIGSFYTQMGVVLDRPREFRDLLRSALMSEYRKPHMSKEQVIQFFEHSVVMALGTLEQKFGGPSRNNLEYWVEDVYESDPENPWVIYEDCFAVWAQNYRHEHCDDIGLGARAGAIFDRYSIRVSTADIVEQVDASKREALSEWDSRMYERKCVEPVRNWYPHFDTLEICVGRNRFQIFWEDIRGGITDQQFERMTDLASHIGTYKTGPSVDARNLRRRLTD